MRLSTASIAAPTLPCAILKRKTFSALWVSGRAGTSCPRAVDLMCVALSRANTHTDVHAHALLSVWRQVCAFVCTAALAAGRCHRTANTNHVALDKLLKMVVVAERSLA